MENREIITVGAQIEGLEVTGVILPNGEKRVAMKAVVEGMGLDWRAQNRKILEHEVLKQGVALTTIPTPGGPQEVSTLPFKSFLYWLALIQTSRIPGEESRKKIVRFQQQIPDVLEKAFLDAEARRAPAQPSGLAMLEMVQQLAAGTITQFKAQQVEIETLKADVAELKVQKSEDWGIAPPKEKSCRAQVNEIVRAHAFISKTYKDDWDRLFREFRYRYGIDAERRADNSPNMDKLDIIEDLGQMKDLRDLAIHLFGKPASWKEQA